MALHSLYCADVPLRNSLTQIWRQNFSLFSPCLLTVRLHFYFARGLLSGVGHPRRDGEEKVTCEGNVNLS